MANRILILDDEETFAEMLLHVMQHEGFLVDCASDPEEALRMLREKPYALIVSDFMMPEMNGAEFLDKARLVVPDVPVIMVSGLMNTPDLLRVANIGVVEVLQKPLNSQGFLETVRRYVQPIEGVADASRSAGQEYRIITFDESKRLYSFPRDWLAYECKSPATYHFLQDLWEASRQSSVLFVEAPVGIPYEDIAKQLAHWKSETAAKGIAVDAKEWLHAVEMDKPPCPASKSVCAVKGLDSLGLKELDVVAKWVKQTKRDDAPTTVFCFQPEWPEKHLNEGFSLRTLAARAEAEAVRMPPLRERLADLSTIARKQLRMMALDMEKLDSVEMMPSVLAVVLGYTWPGNHDQLKRALEESLLEIEEAPITAALLQNALGLWDAEGTEETEPKLPTLEHHLKHCQRNYLERISPHVGGHLPAMLASAGVPPNAAPNTAIFERLPLLYPEMLEE